MYDRQKNAVYEYVVYNGDFSNKKPINIVYGNIAFYNDDIAFICRLEAYQIIDANEKGELKGKLKDIAADLEENSNPVIMIVKNKK